MKAEIPSLPLLIIALNWPTCQSKDELIKDLKLDEIQRNKMCSSYDVMAIDDAITGMHLNEQVYFLSFLWLSITLPFS